MACHSKWSNIKHQKIAQVKILIQSMRKVIVASCTRVSGDEAVAQRCEAEA